jgi:hypothetical protein
LIQQGELIGFDRGKWKIVGLLLSSLDWVEPRYVSTRRLPGQTWMGRDELDATNAEFTNTVFTQ